MKTDKLQKEHIIGIVGGVGPYAGLDLNKKIFDQTIAVTDQDHLKVILISASREIIDRTEYLLDRTNINPAEAIFNVIKALKLLGASVIGIPCNTVYAPPIYNVLLRMIKENGIKTKVINMIDEVGLFLKQNYPHSANIGVLGTSGTVYSGVYSQVLEPQGFRVLYPAEEIQYSLVHSAIYDVQYGIKSISNPVTERAINNIYAAIDHLITKGCDAIILGCTELPLAIKDKELDGRPIIDATLLLARALIREVAPERLKYLTYGRTNKYSFG